MADAPVPPATATPPAAAPANPAPPEAAPPAPAEPRLVGRAALAMFEDLEPEAAPDPKAAPAAAAAAPSPQGTAGKTDGSGPAADGQSAAAGGDPSQPSTNSPSSEPGNSPAPAGDGAPKSAAFRALAEREAKFRREQTAFEAQKAEALRILEWDKKVRENPELLAERYGADIFDRGARVVAGAPPKQPDPNDRVTQLEQRLENERQERERQAQQAQVAQAHAIVRDTLSKAEGDDHKAVLAFGRENEVFDAFSLYVRNNGIQVQNTPAGPRYFDRDGALLDASFESQLVLAISGEVNKQLVEQYGPLVEKVPQFRSRFAPAPAPAPAPAVVAPAAPPQASALPAREAPAPATITGRHGSDAAPSVSNGRRKTVAEVDDDIVSQYFGA